MFLSRPKKNMGKKSRHFFFSIVRANINPMREVICSLLYAPVTTVRVHYVLHLSVCLSVCLSHFYVQHFVIVFWSSNISATAVPIDLKLHICNDHHPKFHTHAACMPKVKWLWQATPYWQAPWRGHLFCLYRHSFLVFHKICILHALGCGNMQHCST